MPETQYVIKSLSSSLDSAFEQFYNAHHGKATLDPVAFDNAAIAYLSSARGEWGKHDDYFNNFTPIWQTYLAARDYSQACALWEWALRPVAAVEAASNDGRIHRGAAYYFWGMSAILGGDIDRGYLLMHAALEEDIETHRCIDPATPAYRLVILDGLHPEQAFRPWVAALSDSLDRRLAGYRCRTGRQLSGNDFRARFLSQVAVREPAFLLSYCLARLKRDHETFRFRPSTFAAQLFANILFDVCLVVDAAIQEKRRLVGWKFIDLAAALSSDAALTLSKSDLRMVNGQFNQDFEGTLGRAIQGNLAVGARVLTGLENSLAVAYGLRNRGAHGPASVPIVAEKVDDILDHVFDVLFLCVETIY